MGTTDDRESISEPLEVTAVSRIHGTRRIHEVTGGHEEDRIRVQEEPRGHHRTREDTALPRFGTVRPRFQIPRPDQSFELKDRRVSADNLTDPLYYFGNSAAVFLKWRSTHTRWPSTFILGSIPARTGRGSTQRTTPTSISVSVSSARGSCGNRALPRARRSAGGPRRWGALP